MCVLGVLLASEECANPCLEQQRTALCGCWAGQRRPIPCLQEWHLLASPALRCSALDEHWLTDLWGQAKSEGGRRGHQQGAGAEEPGPHRRWHGSCRSGNTKAFWCKEAEDNGSHRWLLLCRTQALCLGLLRHE